MVWIRCSDLFLFPMEKLFFEHLAVVDFAFTYLLIAKTQAKDPLLL